MKKQFIIGILLLSNSLMAQQNMTPETLWKLGRLQAETIDQKNNKVIFKVSNYNLEQNKAKTNFFNISTNGGAPTQISNNENIESIIQVDAKTGQITYTYKGQIWQMNADGSDAKQITKIKGNIDNVRISPDGKHILFSKEVAIDKVEGKNRYTDLSKSNAYVFDDLNYRHWDTWSSGKFSHIFYASYNNGEIGTPIDIMKDEPYDVPQKPFGGKEDIIWSPDSKSIIYVSKKKYGK